MKKPHYIKFPISKATEPPQDGACWIYRDRFWLVVDECILFYMGRSPQCNSQESIVARLNLTKDAGEIRFIPLVFVPMSEKADGMDIDVYGEILEIEKKT
jgi:hypothetical protein